MDPSLLPTPSYDGSPGSLPCPRLSAHIKRAAGLSAVVLRLCFVVLPIHALSWVGLISYAILVYVLLDGFDLGVGVLFGMTRREDPRAQMLSAIGNMVQGLTVEGSYYAGGSFDWVDPFGILCGVGLVVGYALLGASWLVLKTSGELQDWAAARVCWLLIGAVGFVVLALGFVLVTDAGVVQRWSVRPWLAVFPLLAAAAAVMLYRWQSHRRGDAVPFLLTAVIFLTAFLMLGGSFWPYMIPYNITIADAAAPTASLEFMFYGAGVVVFPVVLIYTAGVYWVFRGKVGKETGHGG